MTTADWRPESFAAQALGWIDSKTGAVSPPIHMSSTFLRDPDNQYRTGHIYIRDDNPAFEQVEALLTKLEGGASSLVFASGMAAVTSVSSRTSPAITCWCRSMSITACANGSTASPSPGASRSTTSI